MVVLDTCILISDALAPERVSDGARRVIERHERAGRLACSDISLWEIGMLVDKGRLDPGTDALSFLRLVVTARRMNVLPISPEIAAISTSYPAFRHHDPADRIIAATAIYHQAILITFDARLQEIPDLKTMC